MTELQFNRISKVDIYVSVSDGDKYGSDLFSFYIKSRNIQKGSDKIHMVVFSCQMLNY